MSDITARESDVNNEADTDERRPPKRTRTLSDAPPDAARTAAADEDADDDNEEEEEEDDDDSDARWRREAMEFMRPRDDDPPEADIFRLREFLRVYEYTRALEDRLIAEGRMTEAQRQVDDLMKSAPQAREVLRELEAEAAEELEAVAARPPGCA